MALPTAIYQEVRAWITHQEAYEAQHQKPAPLTEAQQMALLVLRLPASPAAPAQAAPPTAAIPIPTPATPSPSSPAPAAAPTNYVGLLQGNQPLYYLFPG